MKKLIVSLAVVAVASIATATNVKWGVSTALDTTTFEDGSMVYLVQGTFSATEPSSGDTWTTSDIGTSFASGSLSGGLYSDSAGVSLTPTNVGSSGNVPFYIAVISKDGKNIATSGGTINVKASALSASFSKPSDSFSITPVPVPEPCSVALLALGLAALGLKRKVA